MPIVGVPLDELFDLLGERIPSDELEHELHRFGCSVEGWAKAHRFRCAVCQGISESAEPEPPAACEICGADLDGSSVAAIGNVDVIKMELLAVRPDLFDSAGLARALRGFFGKQLGAPKYDVRAGEFTIDVDPALAGPQVVRPRITAAIVRGLELDDARLRSLMKLQENIHWALGRDRKLASIGVYDLAKVSGTALQYRAVGPDELSFVPLGYDPDDADSALTPARILAEHPKGKAFARLLSKFEKYPLLADEQVGVLSMPPIINSEHTRVTTSTRDVIIDVTGTEDHYVDRALNIVATSLLETCTSASIETVTVRYEGGAERITPHLDPQKVRVSVEGAGKLIGVGWSQDELVERLRRMRHDVAAAGDAVEVFVPAWRADVMHPRDLMEDAAIAHGYDNLPRVELQGATFAQRDPVEQRADVARCALTGLGCLEVMTLALTSESATYDKTRVPNDDRQVMLENPISIEQTMLRVSLLPGLMETLAVNLGSSYPQRLCEIGSVVFHDAARETGQLERSHAALAIAGDGLGYADVRSMVDSLLAQLGVPSGAATLRPIGGEMFLDGRGAEIEVGGRVVGRLGEVHPQVLEAYRIIHPVSVAELELDTLPLT